MGDGRDHAFAVYHADGLRADESRRTPRGVLGHLAGNEYAENFSTAGSNKNKSIKSIMKNTIAITTAFLSLAITPGCVTNPTTGTQQLDPVVAQSLAQDAAYIGGLALKSQYGGELQLTLQALNAFVAAGTGDLGGLQQALKNLPVNVLNGTNGTLIASGGAILIQQLGTLVLRLDKTGTATNYVIPIATGLRDGLRQALSTSASAPAPQLNAAADPLDRSVPGVYSPLPPASKYGRLATNL